MSTHNFLDKLLLRRTGRNDQARNHSDLFFAVENCGELGLITINELTYINSNL